MKITLIFSLFFILLLPPVKAQDNIALVKTGALILARQFHAKNLGHKSKVMAKLLSIIDKNNPDVDTLIKSIKEGNKIVIREQIKDNGVQYADFFYKEGLDILEPFELSNNLKKEIIAIVCTALDNNSAAKRYLNDDSRTAQAFYRDIFKIKGILGQRSKAIEVYKKAILPTFNYDPAEILKGISTINSFLAQTSVQLKINRDSVESLKLQIDSVDESKGYVIYTGPSAEGVSHDKITMDKLSLKDFLRYLEHTTRLTPQLNALDNSIELEQSKKGQKGRPFHFKSTTGLYKEIKSNRDTARAKYNNKTMQIKGKVTKVKDAGAKYYIELDNVYILEVDKAKLKESAPKDIANKLKEAQQDSKPLFLVARGICQIGSKNTYIKSCQTILNEKIAFFYTK